MRDGPRIGVVGATGAVGTVTLELLGERGYGNVRALASARSAGRTVAYGSGELVIEEATPESLGAGNLDLCLFSVGTSASRELVPVARDADAVCVDKSAAFRLTEGVPLVVPEVNGERARDHGGILANPNCSTIPLTCVLKPLHDAAGLVRVRVATYQSKSGAGAQRMAELRAEAPEEHDVVTDWTHEGGEFEEEAKIREEARKILELPNLQISATCNRIPVLIGHAEAVWVDLERPLSAEEARELLAAAPSVRVDDSPTPRRARGGDEVLVGRIRQESPQSLALFLACDNLRKGAALNAIQIAELLLERRAVAA